MAVVSSACSSKADEPEAVSEFEVTVPTVKPLTAAEVDALLAQLEDPTGAPPADNISASAFATGSAVPDAANPEWQDFIETYTAVRDTAVANGWRLEVVGYTDSTGTDEINVPLSLARAEAAKAALIEIGYPEADVEAKPGGVGGPDESDRRVTVQFVRKDGS